MATHVTDIADLANLTLSSYDRNELVDIATTLRDFPASKKLMEKNRQIARGSDESGKNFIFNLIHTPDSNARNCGIYYVDSLDQSDGTVAATIPWRHMTTGCHFDTHELNVNAGNAQIVSFLKTKEMQMEMGWYALLEANFWGGPSSSSDDTTPFGLTLYWLDHSASAGFNGGNHTNFSGGPGGVSCDTYSRWQHYTAQFTTNSLADSVAKIRRALKETRWHGIPNKPMKDWSYTEHPRVIYTTLDNVDELENLAIGLDDKVGPDLGKYDGAVTIARTPIEEVPWLSDNRATSDPYIGVDWDVVGCVYPRGEWQVEHPYARHPRQRNVRQRFRDASRQFVVINRRRLFTVAKAAYVSS